MSQHDFENESWQDNYYGTGATNPPKSQNKWLMVLLVAVILLGGLAGVLGIMNVQLFRQVSQYEQESARQPHFHPGDRENEEPEGSLPETVSEPAPNHSRRNNSRSDYSRGDDSRGMRSRVDRCNLHRSQDLLKMRKD